MTTITVRNVPPEVRDELASRARRSGRSLQEHLRQMLIEAAGHPTVEDTLASIRADARRAGVHVDPAFVLETLDAERR
ncbi:MAG: hypothetical protein KDC36_08860 [Thermoleophilia bacterium]|nr:hypothetical protein [Thermoleophilia bacterium]